MKFKKLALQNKSGLLNKVLPFWENNSKDEEETERLFSFSAGIVPGLENTGKQ